MNDFQIILLAVGMLFFLGGGLLHWSEGKNLNMYGNFVIGCLYLVGAVCFLVICLVWAIEHLRIVIV